MLQKTLPRLLKAGCLCLASALSLIACAKEGTPAATNKTTMTDSKSSSLEIASVGAGCFWCVEAVFENLDGVHDVESGYMGGEVKDPTYREICTGTTGHAEITQITFDPAVISYETLLDWLWRSHNPTTLNQQGADKGTQYRSAIFYHSEAQRETAEASKAAAQAGFDQPIVTEITEASDYYPAEDYHQDYYRLNKAAPYCQMVIRPKLKKLNLE
ncbi:MAG: peptide-methionine (S)-S-oxide reductase [Lentimonas sp.]|jgi:peptide-methionine (S)-S-oxide reductase